MKTSLDLTFADYRTASWFADVLDRLTAPSSRKVRNLLKKHPHLSPIIQNIVEMRQYNFQTEIDINILGHIFEQSIEDMADFQEGKTESVRKREGIYYTPSYITDFICRNTILPYLSVSGRATDTESLVREYAAEGKLSMLENRLGSMRILDPACGSGAFLVGAANVLLGIHGAVHDEYAKNREYFTKEGRESLDMWSKDGKIRDIVRDNIYGIDKNPYSVRIAQLSMYLLTANENQPLPDTSNHIMAGNSLIADRTVVEDAFLWDDGFPEVFEGGGWRTRV